MSGDGKITVLIAEDEAPIRLLLRVNLQAEGYEVLEAPDGVIALELALKHNPDIILLDAMMPRKDGWEVAKELRENETTAKIPIIFLSARADLKDQERGLKAGALKFITKPFNPCSLAQNIKDCLELVNSGQADQMRSARLKELRKPQEK